MEVLWGHMMMCKNLREEVIYIWWFSGDGVMYIYMEYGLKEHVLRPMNVYLRTCTCVLHRNAS